MLDKKELLNIFCSINEEEIANGLKPELNQEKDIFFFLFEKFHHVFVNNVTIAFNRIQIRDDNIHFYIDDEAVAAIAILNIEDIAI